LRTVSSGFAPIASQGIGEFQDRCAVVVLASSKLFADKNANAESNRTAASCTSSLAIRHGGQRQATAAPALHGSPLYRCGPAYEPALLAAEKARNGKALGSLSAAGKAFFLSREYEMVLKRETQARAELEQD